MSNLLSGISDGFVDEKDEQFSELLRMPEFWRLVFRQGGYDAIFKADFLSNMSQETADEMADTFDMHYLQNRSVDQMIGYKDDYEWTEEAITIRLALIKSVRCAWERGELGFRYEPYHPRLQAKIEQLRSGEKLTEKQRAKLAANAMLRWRQNQFVYPIHLKVLKQELAGLDKEAIRRNVRRIMCMALEDDNETD